MQLNPEPFTSLGANLAPEQYCHPLKHFRDLAIAEERIDEKDDMGVLRSSCLENGMTRAGWRFLNRWGKDAYAAILPLVDGTQNAFDVVFSYIVWQCAGGMQRPLAGELGRRVISCMGDYYTREIAVDPRLARVADEHLCKLTDPDIQKNFTERDWMRVTTWMRDVKPEFDRNQWRSGWPAIFRNYLKWKKLNPTANTWHSALQAFDEGEFHVEPLSSSYQLAQEGYRMQHCVTTYGKRCFAGKYRLFSVSAKSSSKPLVTIGISREGAYWKIDQIKGRFNQDPMPEPARLGLLIQRRYTQEEERQQRKKIMRRRRCLDQLRATHQAYRVKRLKVPNVTRGKLSDEDVDLLEKTGVWLNALATGELQPTDFEQVRFIAVTQGILRPKTQQERVWLKYQRVT